MRLPRYGTYKDSGIPWVGKVPAHWSLLRTKTLFELMRRPPRDEDGVVTAFRDGEVTLRTNRRTDGFTNSLQEIGYQGVRRGDLVIHAMDAFAGAIGVSDSDGKSTPVYSVCRPRKGLSDSKYYGRLLRHMALSGFIESLAKGIRERSTEFRWAEAGNVYLPLPPVTEQAAIADFLNRETAKIDALIAEQEKLIALLAEKRQATISHAVTKGLNPNAPMKDSGVAWLGEVPEHWKVCPLKLLSRIGNGSTPNRDNPDYWSDEGFPWLNSAVVNREEVSEAERFVTDLALKECHLPVVEPPAVLVGITGQGKTRGMATRLAFTATVNQHLAYVKPTEKLLSEAFLLYVFEATYQYLRTESEGAGSTKGAITCEQLGNLRIPLPEFAEQLAILMFLDRETAKLNALKQDCERGTTLLKERRSALIAAAVTGQIDVRAAALPQLT